MREYISCINHSSEHASILFGNLKRQTGQGDKGVYRIVEALENFLPEEILGEKLYFSASLGGFKNVMHVIFVSL